MAAAGPLLLFHYGRDHWFHRDEWAFLSESAQGGDAWMRYTHDAFSGSHWVAVPRLVYQGLWHAVGMTTYLPYLLVVVVLHLGLACLVHLVMRRAGVRPWLAAAAAAVFVLAGPGSSTTVWAFQMTIIGSMTFGYAHLVLADHDGPWGRRDNLGLGCGLLAITCSGVGVTTTAAVVVAVLLRRGWRAAALHGGPLALVYSVWAVLAGAQTTSDQGRPSLSVLAGWLRESALGTIQAIGRWQPLAAVTAAVLAGGLLLAWQQARRHEEDEGGHWHRLAAPIGLALGAVVFATTTAMGRAWAGLFFARSDRYMYLEAALVLPLLAVAAEAIARRWRIAVPVLVAVFLAPVPFNLTTFDTQTIEARIFDDEYHARRRYLLTTAPRVPFANDVPRDVEPVPDPYAYGVTMGFLLETTASDRLPESTEPLTPRMVNEFRVRLGLWQQDASVPPGSCQTLEEITYLSPALGDRIWLGSLVSISTAAPDGRRSSRGVPFNPKASGEMLEVVLPDLHLAVKAPPGSSTYVLCEP